MMYNLFGNQVRLFNSQADLTEWSDTFGSGKTYGALVKALNTAGTILYVSNRAKSTFDNVPEELLDGFKKTFVDLRISSENTKIYFLNNSSFLDRFQGLRPELVVFDGPEPFSDDIMVLISKGTKVVVLRSGLVEYRETWFKAHKN